MKSRIIFVCVILLLFCFTFVVRGIVLQFFPDERLISVKKKNFERVIKLKPRRGIIYDRHGRELAISIASQSLFADPFLIKNPKQIAKKLSRLLGISYSSLYKKIKNKKRRFVWIKRHITDEEWEKIKSWKIYGLAFLEEPKRMYPNGSLLAQMMGFVGRDGHGLEGIELSYDHFLSGEEKKVLVYKDARGRPLFSDVIFDTSLVNLRSNGADIYLTIDSDLQFFFEKELRKVVEHYSARSGVGIIMNPQTGEILSLAHFPSFNLNQPFQSDPQLFRNRAVTDAFEPGSTLKSFVVGAALKNDTPPTQRYEGSEEGFLVENHVIREAEAGKYFQNLDLREILSFSSNVGAAQVALDVGDQSLYNLLKDFGFGSKLGIVFPGENPGILNKPPWKKLQLATIGFGHAVSVTPLQMVTAYSAIANGGMLKQPYFVSSIRYKETNRTETYEAKDLRQVLTPEQARIMTMMLISAVSYNGTGSKAQVKGFLSAGKTGTAQVVDKEQGGYLTEQYISSFVGFIPAHKPQFVIYVAVEQPQEKFYGSTVAAPVFSNVAEYAVRQAGLSPILISERDILQEKEVDLKQKKVKRNLAEARGHVPYFIGLSLREAYQKARDTEIRLKVKGSGKVVSVIPLFGEPLPTDRKISLILE